MRTFIPLLTIAIATIASAQTANEQFEKLLEDDWDWTMETFPTYASYVGVPGYDDKWTDITMEAINARRDYPKEQLRKLNEISYEGLSVENQLNFDLKMRETQLSIESTLFPTEFQPITQLGGIQQSIASLVARTKLVSLDDYENLIKRLEGAGKVISDTQTLLELGLEAGVTPPKITLRDVPEQVLNQLVDDIEDSPIYTPFNSLPDTFDDKTKERLQARAKAAIEKKIYPTYRELHSFLVQDYLPGARETIACTDLPNGEEWYAYNVRSRTTTNMTPQEIHDLGQSEVKRIRAEMIEIMKSTGFEGDFDAFIEFLRTDEQFYCKTAEELLQLYRDIAKRADPELMKLFGTLPRTPYGVIPVPSYAEKSQTTAYYQPGSPASGRPGYFYANTYALDTRPTWEMEALTLHEAVPGHHLQISIAQELTDIPEFRKWGGPTAYIEGWGLYAESLGEEMGFYTDPYSKFGQLTYEMWRAVRLVVDTGMHSLGWTRQEAIDFFAANSSKNLHDITVEIDRYIVWPGQALAYKIGELKIKELRARATEELGDDFDIREFHDVVLGQGALPLDVLEKQVNRWIEVTKSE